MWNSGPMPTGPIDNRPGWGLLARLAARLRGGDRLTPLDRAHTGPDGTRIPLADERCRACGHPVRLHHHGCGVTWPNGDLACDCVLDRVAARPRVYQWPATMWVDQDEPRTNRHRW